MTRSHNEHEVVGKPRKCSLWGRCWMSSGHPFSTDRSGTEMWELRSNETICNLF